MRLLPVLLVSLSVSSLGLMNPNPSLSSNLVAQLGGLGGLGDVEDATTDVLKRLGYDCKTATVGIACTKCSDNKCKAYICDAITKKCRKQKASLPGVPDSVDDLTDVIDIPGSDDLTDDVDVPDSGDLIDDVDVPDSGDLTGDVDVPDSGDVTSDVGIPNSVEDLLDNVDIDTDKIPGL